MFHALIETNDKNGMNFWKIAYRCPCKLETTETKKRVNMPTYMGQQFPISKLAILRPKNGEENVGQIRRRQKEGLA